MSEKPDHKRVFGAGFHAGVKSILGEDENDMSLSASRIKILEQSQSGIAKKVYECVPRNEAWDAKRITGELGRLGSAPDFHIVQGCLSSLKDSGLVVEAIKGLFQRAKPRAEPSLKEVAQNCKARIDLEVAPRPSSVAAEETAAKKSEPIDILASATSGLRELGARAISIADQIDDAVLAIDAQANEQSEEMQKLRQLATLIKGLSA